MSYQIIFANEGDELEALVRDEMKDGWKPLGAPFCVLPGTGAQNCHSGWYQAMTK